VFVRTTAPDLDQVYGHSLMVSASTLCWWAARWRDNGQQKSGSGVWGANLGCVFARADGDGTSISINLMRRYDSGHPGQLHRTGRAAHAQGSRDGAPATKPVANRKRRHQHSFERVTSLQHQAPPAQGLAAGIPRGKKSSLPGAGAPAEARSESCPASRRWPTDHRSWADAPRPTNSSAA